MFVYEFEGKRPNIHPDAFIAPTATLIGDVTVEAGASVWYGAVLRADICTIIVREGANIQVVRDGRVALDTEGPYQGPFIYQRIAPLKAFDGRYPVIGSWVVNGWACGIGIREDDKLVTQNTSRFVPHRMAD